MPDVSRSDSQRSDTSLRPRVSFNRDVHVKRIVPREGARVSELSVDGDDHLVSPTRKDLSRKSKKELADEAARVIEQADKLNCFSLSHNQPPDKFFTLPNRRKSNLNYPSASLDRKWARKRTPDPANDPTPKKPHSKPLRSNLTRSVSDASSLKPRAPLYDARNHLNTHNHKQLSPIIESTQSEDYFTVDHHQNNIKTKPPTSPPVVVIDIDKAEKISSKFRFKDKLKSITGRKDNKENKTNAKAPKKEEVKKRIAPQPPKPSLVTKTISSLANAPKASPKMIHSSQKPAEKLPLTRGRKVDWMVQRLNNDPKSPPPKANLLGPVTLQHNKNQPFSYTRGLSPDKFEAPGSPLIYAQVVCNDQKGKQTVHTSYPKHQTQSDSDEGLGYDEGSLLRTKTVTRFGDDIPMPEESPILPKYRLYDETRLTPDKFFADSNTRGRADGMDSKRRESFSEQELIEPNRNDLSARRDLLELRINRRIGDKTEGRFARSGSSSPGKHLPAPKAEERFRTSQKNVYKSTPDIYRQEWSDHQREKLGDSGIETDVRSSTWRKNREYVNESEDEGFASSLLIASERQHAETHRRNAKKGYESAEDTVDAFYDPKLGKMVVLRSEKKPPKPEKKSGLEKVKRLFVRDGKKKTDKKEMVREESLRARYTEYKGSKENLFSKKPTERFSSRRRLSTPSPHSSPTRDSEPIEKSENVHTSWFKSLDRLSRKKKKEPAKPNPKTIREDSTPSGRAKSLRFFGDTDADSNDSARRPNKISYKDRMRSQSTKELHNISEEIDRPVLVKGTKNHKSMVNISSGSLKPPLSPHRRAPEASRVSRRKRHEISSVESSTEGESSQQSQRSIVYLHAATVGDIPGPIRVKYKASREDAPEPGRLQPQVKTLSRSFSVLAPWKPRLAHEPNNIDYSDQTLKRRPHHRSTTLKKRSSSKENVLAKEDLAKGSSSTLYKKKGRLPRENSRYSRDREEKRMSAAKSMSVESLRSNGRAPGAKSREPSRDVSRSLSMPKDPQKSAGWFKINKKNHHRSEYSSQRL